MFCMKCGEIIEDGEELCQACRQQDPSVGEIIKQKLEEMGKTLKDTGGEAVKEAQKEVEKAVQKKTKQVVHKTMVKVGLKKKTPLDKAKDMWKKIKR